MGWEGIGDLIGTIAKWWTPEQVKARARTKLQQLKEEESEIIINKKCDAKSLARLDIVRRDIKRLQNSLSNS